MADLSILRTAAQLYDVVPNFDTSIHPTPSDPPDPPEQPQAPQPNDGDSDVVEMEPPSPQGGTMRKVRKPRGVNQKALLISEHVRIWLADQTGQERNKYEAEWLGKGHVLSTHAEANILAQTIVAKTGFVVPDDEEQAWKSALTQLPKALNNKYEHGHHTPQPTSNPPLPQNNLNDVPDPDVVVGVGGPVPARSVGPCNDINVADWVAEIISRVVEGDTIIDAQPADQNANSERRPRGRPRGGRGRGQRGAARPRRPPQRRNGADSSERRINVRSHPDTAPTYLSDLQRQKLMREVSPWALRVYPDTCRVPRQLTDLCATNRVLLP